MDDRIKKALFDLDNATVLNQLPILSNELATNNNSGSNNNNESIEYDDNVCGVGSNNQSLLITSYRPWSNTDYYNRVRSYTISNWFAKPSEIDPLQCSRFGWVNCDTDMLECETCKKRLYFKVPNSFNHSLVNKRIHDFLVSLQSTGHRDNCPWKDNGCPSFFSRLLDIPFQTQLDAFIKRSQNIYDNLISIPILSDEFHQQWIIKQGQDKSTNVLNIIMKIVKLPLDDIKSKTACLIALCGWDFNQQSDQGSNNSEDKEKKKEDIKSSVYCSYCQRVCGIWNFIENKSKENPFHEEKVVYSLGSGVIGSKRKRDHTDLEEEQNNLKFEKVIGQSFSHNNNNNNNNKSLKTTPTKQAPPPSLFSTFGSFSNISSTNLTTGWSWGDSFSSATTDFKVALEAKSKEKSEFSPINEHRWFCPWKLNIDSNRVITDNNDTLDNANNSETNNDINNNNNNNNNNTSITGWENLLRLLLNQSTFDSKDYIDLKSDKKFHSIVNSLTASVYHKK